MFTLSKKRGFAKGAALTAAVCVLALAGVVYAFIANSSPYVTVAQARASTADNLHVAGDIIRDTVHQDLANRTLTFDMKDETGTVKVVYTGTPPQNMGEANKVVAEGGMKDGVFLSDKILVKCPSKYESEKKS
ncbi:MAG TPA: cytochrome c maturation protein CcmE [Fimbriimonadaceae bacterium]|nr:cytochrome c maturation protein CcmE [Fimbriimonadaceae bacterium]